MFSTATSPIVLLAAAHQPPPLIDIDSTLFIQVGLFLLLYLILRKTVFLRYLDLKYERQQKIEGTRADAAADAQRARDKLAHYETEVRDARRRAAAQRVAHLEEAERAKSSQVDAARTQAENEVETMRARLAQSGPAAELALRAHTDKLARVLAAKVLGRPL